MVSKPVCVSLYIGYTAVNTSDHFRQAYDETLDEFFARVKVVAEMRQSQLSKSLAEP